MGFSTSTIIVIAIAAYTSLCEAALASVCPSDSVCFQWGVPESSSGPESGAMYLQLQASPSYQWIGLGTGSRMRGSNMLVVYQNGHGNVTLSTRQSTGHSMPTYAQRPDVQLLEGSGVLNGTLRANIRCGECSDVGVGGSSNWITAWKQGPPLYSSDLSEAIAYHDGYSSFTVDLAQAAIASDENPFLSNNSSVDTHSGLSSAISRLNTVDQTSETAALLWAHGIVMSVVFLIGFPAGSFIMLLVGRWKIHAGWQVLSFIGLCCGFAIGVMISPRYNGLFQDSHTRLGVIVFALMAIQPVLGWLHHVHYCKYRKRGIVSHIHVWYGRCLMGLGIVAGGLGLWLARAPQGFIITYCVVAGLVALCYCVSIVFGRRKYNGAAGKDVNTYMLPDMSEESRLSSAVSKTNRAR
ncbi:DUF2427 domain protein [Metarhizium robertsii]|uniref:DUF2427 domain protein n=1 Tax=Metarhizium robertsii TaxID=568076 RepID=A0A014MVX3_9HYPO|nr:DUF2427 domain protein [Metarhizium robertsii]